MDILNSYKLLQVTPLDSFSFIKSSYKKKLLSSHPDKGGSSSQFIALQSAYSTLSTYHSSTHSLFLPLSDFISPPQLRDILLHSDFTPILQFLNYLDK